MSGFKKPDSDTAWYTVFIFILSCGMVWFGVRGPSPYLLVTGMALGGCSAGIWFQSRRCAIALIAISGSLILIGTGCMIFLRFAWQHLFMLFVHLGLIVTLRDWLKQNAVESTVTLEGGE